MSRRLRTLIAPLVWRCRAGVELTQEQADGPALSLVAYCSHPPGSWSYCTGGYRYCLACMRVRVRC